MRVAVVGKGGVGKTTIAGTLARLLARRGRRVLAVDFDTNPGLALTLGLEPSDRGLPAEALEQAEGRGAAYGWRLRSGITPAEAVERFTREAPDGVRYLTAGKIDRPDHEVRMSTTAVRQIVRGFDDPGWDVVGDIEAGPTTPFEGYLDFADSALLVLTPGWTSVLTARRLLPLLGDIPATIVGSRFDGQAPPEGLPLELRIPLDGAVVEADRLGLAPLDHCESSPAVRAVAALADRLVESEARA